MGHHRLGRGLRRATTSAAAVTAALALCSVAAGPAHADDASGSCGDSGEATETSRIIDLGTDVSRSFCPQHNDGFGDLDFVRFSAEKGARYRITVAPGPELAGSSVTFAESYVFFGPWSQDGSFASTSTPLEAGVYQVMLLQWPFVAGRSYPYTVRVTKLG